MPSTHPAAARVIFGISALAFMGSGCRGTGPSPSDVAATASSTEAAVPAGIECRHEYYPLVTGYRARYRTTINGEDKGTFSVSVPWVRDNEAYLAAEFQGVGGGESVISSQQYKCVAGAMEAKAFVDSGSLQPGTGMNLSRVETVATTGTFFPKDVAPGTRWEYSIKMKMKMASGARTDGFALPANLEPVTVTVVTKKRAIGIESVDLPIGRKNAMKIEVSVLFDGVPTLSKTEWWAKDIGMVKSVSRGGTLASDPSTVTIIQDYAVPGL